MGYAGNILSKAEKRSFYTLTEEEFMKVPALILCIIAAVITLVFAVQFISFYISPSDLSAPGGLNNEDQLYWDTHIAVLTPDTFLAFGLIGLVSVIAGMIGGVLQFFEKRLTLACGLMIAAAGLSYFIAITPVSYLYLAVAVTALRKPEKAVEGLAASALAFIGATYIVQWVTGLFLNGTFLSHIRFEGAILVATTNTQSGYIYVFGILLGIILIGTASVMLYRRQQTMPAAALAVTAIGFIILLFKSDSTAIVLVPFALFVFALIVLIIKFLKRRKAEPKEV